MKTDTGYYIFRCEIPQDELPRIVDNLPEQTRENVQDIQVLWNSFLYPLPTSEGNVRVRVGAPTIRELHLEPYVNDPAWARMAV